MRRQYFDVTVVYISIFMYIFLDIPISQKTPNTRIFLFGSNERPHVSKALTVDTNSICVYIFLAILEISLGLSWAVVDLAEVERRRREKEAAEQRETIVGQFMHMFAGGDDNSLVDICEVFFLRCSEYLLYA